MLYTVLLFGRISLLLDIHIVSNSLLVVIALTILVHVAFLCLIISSLISLEVEFSKLRRKKIFKTFFMLLVKCLLNAYFCGTEYKALGVKKRGAHFIFYHLRVFSLVGEMR